MIGGIGTDDRSVPSTVFCRFTASVYSSRTRENVALYLV